MERHDTPTGRLRPGSSDNDVLCRQIDVAPLQALDFSRAETGECANGNAREKSLRGGSEQAGDLCRLEYLDVTSAHLDALNSFGRIIRRIASSDCELEQKVNH